MNKFDWKLENYFLAKGTIHIEYGCTAVFYGGGISYSYYADVSSEDFYAAGPCPFKGKMRQDGFEWRTAGIRAGTDFYRYDVQDNASYQNSSEKFIIEQLQQAIYDTYTPEVADYTRLKALETLYLWAENDLEESKALVRQKQENYELVSHVLMMNKSEAK